MLPMQVGVQEACARIGAVTGKGIAAVVREHYSRPVLYVMVLLVLVANTINIGADIGAMAAAANLLLPLPLVIFPVLFAVLMLALEIFLPYRVYARILKWLVLSLLAYPITVFIVSEPWPAILQATFLPHIELTFQFLFIIIGVLGTTISMPSRLLCSDEFLIDLQAEVGGIPQPQGAKRSLLPASLQGMPAASA